MAKGAAGRVGEVGEVYAADVQPGLVAVLGRQGGLDLLVLDDPARGRVREKSVQRKGELERTSKWGQKEHGTSLLIVPICLLAVLH
jgi:hypothetical protein